MRIAMTILAWVFYALAEMWIILVRRLPRALRLPLPQPRTR